MRISTFFLFALLTGTVTLAQVAVNSDGAAPDASAMLEVSSTNSGVLIPRMTAAQRDAIPSPATGLMVYVTDDSLFHFYNGTAWTAIAVPDGDGSATNELQTLSKSGTDVTLSDGGGTVSIADNDNDASNEIQTLTRTGNHITLSGGGDPVHIGDNDNDSTNELQVLSLDSGSIIRLSNGGSVTLPDNSDTNELDSKWTAGTNVIYHNGGRVGIGTLNPDTLLHLSSASIADTGGFKITQGSNNSLFTHNTDGDLVMGKLSATNQLVLDAGSSVGIGTNAPGQKLDVNGQVRIRGGNPGAGKVLTSSDGNGNAVWGNLALPMASTEGGGTVVIAKGSGSGWGRTSYNAFMSRLKNGDRVLVFVSFKMQLQGGSGTDEANFRIEADNQSGGSQYSMNTGVINDLNRNNWVLYSFHRFIEINQGAGNYRFYLQVDETLANDTLNFDQQEISVIKF